MGPGNEPPETALSLEDARRVIRELQARQAVLEAETAAQRRDLRKARAEADGLRARYEELDLMLDTVPVSLAYGDAEYNILHANRAMADWWGHRKEELVGRNLREVMLPGGFEAALPFMSQVIATGQPMAHERMAVGRDGQVHILRQSYAPHLDEAGRVQGLAGIVLDITEERRADEKLRESARQAAVAEERNRLARDLHDAATQTIYSAMLIAEALPQVWARSPEEGQRDLVKLRQLVRGALAEMRTLLFELRPWTLEAVELSRLLEYLKDSLTGRTRVRVEWDTAGEYDFAPDAKTAVYRIAQEAFNNIVKHARASTVRVRLRCEEGQGRLLVEDDGRGFDPAAVTGDHMGLQIMHERAEALGGALRIDSAPGRGTRVTVTWTVQEQSHV